MMMIKIKVKVTRKAMITRRICYTKLKKLLKKESKMRKPNILLNGKL